LGCGSPPGLQEPAVCGSAVQDFETCCGNPPAEQPSRRLGAVGAVPATASQPSQLSRWDGRETQPSILRDAASTPGMGSIQQQQQRETASRQLSTYQQLYAADGVVMPGWVLPAASPVPFSPAAAEATSPAAAAAPPSAATSPAPTWPAAAGSAGDPAAAAAGASPCVRSQQQQRAAERRLPRRKCNSKQLRQVLPGVPAEQRCYASSRQWDHEFGWGAQLKFRDIVSDVAAV